MIEFENISYSYPFQETKAVENLSLSVGAGECVLLTGPSGLDGANMQLISNCGTHRLNLSLNHFPQEKR